MTNEKNCGCPMCSLVERIVSVMGKDWEPSTGMKLVLAELEMLRSAQTALERRIVDTEAGIELWLADQAKAKNVPVPPIPAVQASRGSHLN